MSGRPLRRGPSRLFGDQSIHEDAHEEVFGPGSVWQVMLSRFRPIPCPFAHPDVMRIFVQEYLATRNVASRSGKEQGKETAPAERRCAPCCLVFPQIWRSWGGQRRPGASVSPTPADDELADLKSCKCGSGKSADHAPVSASREVSYSSGRRRGGNDVLEGSGKSADHAPVSASREVSYSSGRRRGGNDVLEVVPDVGVIVSAADRLGHRRSECRAFSSTGRAGKAGIREVLRDSVDHSQSPTRVCTGVNARTPPDSETEVATVRAQPSSPPEAASGKPAPGEGADVPVEPGADDSHRSFRT
jgi:hypothetical protein